VKNKGIGNVGNPKCLTGCMRNPFLKKIQRKGIWGPKPNYEWWKEWSV